MGDVPLGLYGVNLRIRQFFPDVEIIYLTRDDLLDVFSMLPHCTARAIPGMARGASPDLKGYTPLLTNLDPTSDLPWLPGMVVPRLLLPKISLPFSLEGKRYIGMHVDTETGTYYGYEKNWSKANWEQLIQKVVENGGVPILFGKKKTSHFAGVVDLRGETTLIELCSVLLNHCTTLVAPDSGILSTIYYVDSEKPLRVVSLWNDPNQGVLRQAVPSPNPLLEHIPLIGLESISPDDIYSHIKFEQRCEK